MKLLFVRVDQRSGSAVKSSGSARLRTWPHEELAAAVCLPNRALDAGIARSETKKSVA